MIKDTIQEAAAVAEQLRGFAAGSLTITRTNDGRWHITSPALNCRTCRHEDYGDALSETCRACINADTAYALWEPKS